MVVSISFAYDNLIYGPTNTLCRRTFKLCLLTSQPANDLCLPILYIYFTSYNGFSIPYLVSCRFIDNSKIYDIKVFPSFSPPFAIDSSERSEVQTFSFTKEKSNPIFSTNKLHKKCIIAKKFIENKQHSFGEVCYFRSNFKAFDVVATTNSAKHFHIQRFNSKVHKTVRKASLIHCEQSVKK